MKNINTKILTKYITHYLENRPAFFTLIRSQEAYLFHHYDSLIKPQTLDFGCGDGFFAKMVFGKGRIDVGLDLRNSRIEEGRALKIYKKLVAYDGKVIPFKDKTFQSVISNCVLEHIPEIQQNVNEISRVTKVNGHFLTGVMTNNWERFQFGPLFFGEYYKKKMRKQQEHFNLLTQKQWDAIFKKAGFEIVSCTGYVNPNNAKWLDLFHYLSIPALLTYRLTGKWVLFKKWYKLLPFVPFILKKVQTSLQEGTVEDSSAFFYVLKKVKEVVR